MSRHARKNLMREVAQVELALIDLLTRREPPEADIAEAQSHLAFLYATLEGLGGPSQKELYLAAARQQPPTLNEWAYQEGGLRARLRFMRVMQPSSHELLLLHMKHNFFSHVLEH